MTTATDTLDAVLSGALSERNQGFMIVLPRGYRLTSLMEERLVAAYGTTGHPDIRRLTPEGAGDMIKVDAVREAQGFLASTASGDGMKTLVLYRAHRMNESAANALLKPLEEPTRSTRIMLLTDNPAPLPPTIRSRCSVLPIAPDGALALRELTDELATREIAKTKLSPEELLVLADGDPSLAADIAQHDLSAWIDKVRTWFGSDAATPPLPTLSGKSGVSLVSASMTLQALMARAARAEVSLKGWTLERAVRASWIGIERSSDITRAGIDAKSRLHTMLMDLRAA